MMIKKLLTRKKMEFMRNLTLSMKSPAIPKNNIVVNIMIVLLRLRI